MKTLYLHIGLQKTGTSSIQMHLMAPQGPLEQAGIDFLPAAIAPRNAHHNAALEMSRNRRHDPALPGMEALLAAAQASPQERLFVSSEDFSLLALPDIEDLGRRLAPFSVQVILCLRNQLDWSESLFAQAGKRNDPGTFAEFSDRLMADGKLDFLTLVQNWAGVFGQDRLWVMIYENHPDISTEMARLLGVALKPGRARKNQSLNERFVAASQAVIDLCRSGALARGNLRVPAEKALLVSARALAIGARMPQFVGSPVFLDRATAQAYLDRSRSLNRALAALVPLPKTYFTVSAKRRAPKNHLDVDPEALTRALFDDPQIQAVLVPA